MRQAKWSHFNLAGKNPEWIISEHLMKARRDQLVPLPRQAIQILKELKRHSGNGRYPFPGIRRREKPISDNPLNAALRGLGYPKE